MARWYNSKPIYQSVTFKPNLYFGAPLKKSFYSTNKFKKHFPLDERYMIYPSRSHSSWCPLSQYAAAFLLSFSYFFLLAGWATVRLCIIAISPALVNQISNIPPSLKERNRKGNIIPWSVNPADHAKSHGHCKRSLCHCPFQKREIM